MTKKLKISNTLSLPLEWMQNATVVYGSRGSGKTVFSKVVAEEVHAAGQRFCAIDLKGDFYGLKSSADGKRAAIPVIIFGGDHADVPLEPDAGAFVGETVAKLEQSCVLDFEHMSKGKQIRFLAEFFAALYHHNRDPLLLLLDEAQRYATQKPIDPDAAKCLGAVEDIVKLGRKHGLGVVLTTQRGSGLAKEVSELCELLVAFRTPGPLDQERVRSWLDANASKTERDQVMGKLSGLPTGTAIFASGHPALKAFGEHAVRMCETFDSSATPKIGQRRREPKLLAKADLSALEQQMKGAIERAKADDPRELRKQIVFLQKQLHEKKPAAPGPAAKEKRVEVPALSAKDREALGRHVSSLDNLIGLSIQYQRKVVDDAQTISGRMADRTKEAQKLADTLRAALAPAQPAAMTNVSATAIVRGKIDYPPRPIPKPARVEAGPGDASVGTGGLRRILIALAQRPQGLTNRQIGLRAGLSSQSGTFSTYLSRARQAGWVEDRGDIRLITDAGVKALGSYEPLPTGQALLDHWLCELGQSGAARILRACADAYPKELSNEEIGAAAGISAASGTFSTYMSRLRGLELIEGSRGRTTASAELFA